MEPWMHDVPRAVAEAQRSLRESIADLAGRYAAAAAALRDEVAVVRAEQAAGGAVPEAAFTDVAAHRVSPETTARIKRRGCVVVRGVYSPQQTTAWNDEIGRYLDDNHYLDHAKQKAGLDQYFSALAAGRPQIYAVYWSRPQMQARQGEPLAITRAFLNRLWTYEKNGETFFDPDRQATYADRVRRREPGDATLGLSPHSDGGSVERWCEPSFRHLYREIIDGDPLRFDPFDADGRTRTKEIPSPAVCSAFRTFQGWTALTRQGPGDGTLRLVPIAKTMPYMFLRALQPDVPEGDLCGAQPGRALGASPRWHGELLEGLVSIPQMQPGDTIWWHSDLIHAVEDEHRGSGYSNVIYIGSAPWCDKNAAFVERQATAFLAGRSSPDFAPEDYEVDFAGRATLDDLSPLGQRQMGLKRGLDAVELNALAPPDFRGADFLLGHIRHTLAFYDGRCRDPSGGFFHFFADDGTVYDRRTRHLVSSTRFVFNHALAARRFDWPGAVDGVRHGLAFLEQAHRQPNGGYAWQLDWHDGRATVTDATNHCYGLAFVLLAYSHAKLAGVEEAAAGIADTFALMEQRFWQPAHGLYADEATADWRLTGYRGQNANMHACEALMAAFDATGGARFLDRALTIAENITGRQAALAGGLIWEHYRADWSVDRDYNRDDKTNIFRPWGFQTGHLTEWAKLLLQLEARLPAERRADWMAQRAVHFFDTAMRHGWDDQHAGLVYGFAPGGEVCDFDKYFWVQAESFAAAALLALRHVGTGDDGYWQWYDRIWAYAWQHFVDHEHGAWFRIRTRDNRPYDSHKSPAGKTDYHTMGACHDVLRGLGA